MRSARIIQTQRTSMDIGQNLNNFVTGSKKVISFNND